MSADALTVLREALALPESDRAGIAAELLASLPEPDVGGIADSAQWIVELERRAHGILSGETACEDWDVVEKRLVAKFGGG